MSELVRFDLQEGGTVLVEVDDGAFGFQRTGVARDIVVQAGKKLEAALATIRPTARAALDAMSGLAPNELQLQFGVKLTAETDAVIAKSGAECNFYVTLTWRDNTDG